MQVSITLIAIEYDVDEDVYRAAFVTRTAEEARAMGARIGREIVIEMPDAQPPDVFVAIVPEEEAETNAPKGRK